MYPARGILRVEGLQLRGGAAGENYVLDEGKSLMLALSQDLEQNRPVEAREHVKRFHELFFTLAPDKSAIESNIQRAMFLGDRSAYAHYVDLAEQGYYNRIISGNVNQRIGIDSVKCDFNTYPYEVVTYAKLSIIREKSVTERSLVTRGAAELHTQRQQPARLHHGGVPRGGEQGYKSV